MNGADKTSLELKPNHVVENGGLENGELSENGVVAKLESAEGESSEIANDINGHQNEMSRETRVFDVVSMYVNIRESMSISKEILFHL